MTTATDTAALAALARSPAAREALANQQRQLQAKRKTLVQTISMANVKFQGVQPRLQREREAAESEAGRIAREAAQTVRQAEQLAGAARQACQLAEMERDREIQAAQRELFKTADPAIDEFIEGKRQALRIQEDTNRGIRGAAVQGYIDRLKNAIAAAERLKLQAVEDIAAALAAIDQQQ